MKHLTLLLLSILLFITCKPDANQKEGQNDQSKITELIFKSDWILTELYGEPIPEFVTSESIPTIQFNESENRIYGRGGCNQYNGAFELNAETGEMDLTQIAATKMACPDMSIEDRYFTMLDEVDRIEHSSENLKFFNSSDETNALFEVMES